MSARRCERCRVWDNDGSAGSACAGSIVSGPHEWGAETRAVAKAKRLPARLWPPATPADAQAAAVAFLVSRGWRQSGQWWTSDECHERKTQAEALALSLPSLLEWVARLELRLQDLEQRRPGSLAPDRDYYEKIAEDAIARDKWGGR